MTQQFVMLNVSGETLTVYSGSTDTKVQVYAPNSSSAAFSVPVNVGSDGVWLATAKAQEFHLSAAGARGALHCSNTALDGVGVVWWITGPTITVVAVPHAALQHVFASFAAAAPVLPSGAEASSIASRAALLDAKCGPAPSLSAAARVYNGTDRAVQVGGQTVPPTGADWASVAFGRDGGLQVGTGACARLLSSAFAGPPCAAVDAGALPEAGAGAAHFLMWWVQGVAHLAVLEGSAAAARVALWLAGNRQTPPPFSVVQHLDAGSQTTTCAATSTLPPGGMQACAGNASSGCLGTRYSTAPSSCSYFNTKANGVACRQAAEAAGASGDALVKAVCDKCVNGDGSCSSAGCPAICLASHPQCAHNGMYMPGGSAGGTFSLDFTVASFVNAFVESTLGDTYPLRKGKTPEDMREAVRAGLTDNVECWWPEANDAAIALSAVQSGDTAAGQVSSSCNRLLLTSSQRDKWGNWKKTCPGFVKGLPIACRTAVAQAISNGVNHETANTKMTHLTAYLMTNACGIKAGIMEPRGLADVTEPKSILRTALYAAAGSVAVIALIVIAVHLVKVHKAKMRAASAPAAAAAK